MPDDVAQPAAAPSTWSSPPEGHARTERAVFAVCLLAMVVALGWDLGRHPGGLSIDEAGVGMSARALARHGTDENGERFPLYFPPLHQGVAAGQVADPKSPFLVYPAALAMKVVGDGPLAVRLPVLVFALLAAGLLWVLLRLLEVPSTVSRWLALLSLGVPSLYVYARHANEAGAMPVCVLAALVALVAWERSPSRARAIIAGVVIGIFTYSYNPARLAAPIMLAAAAWAGWADERLRRHVPYMVVAAALTVVPFAMFLFSQPDLSARFSTMSVAQPGQTPHQVAWAFVTNMAEHLSPDFLFHTGDANARHNAGAGLLAAWMVVPLLAGIMATWRRRDRLHGRVLLVLLATSAIPASLTVEGIPHASRTLHMVPLALVACGLGVMELGGSLQAGRWLLLALLGFGLLESADHVARYHTRYREKAFWAFDQGGGLALDLAWKSRSPGQRFYVAPEFFIWNGLLVRYWLHVDPLTWRDGNWEATGIRLLEQEVPTPGSLVVGLSPLTAAPGGTLLGTVVAPDGRRVFEVWRAAGSAP